MLETMESMGVRLPAHKATITLVRLVEVNALVKLRLVLAKILRGHVCVMTYHVETSVEADPITI